MKTLIAIPCMDMVATPFCQSIATLQKIGDCSVSFMVGSLIYDGRNNLCKQALEIEADYILWFDSDMLFNPDTFSRLLKTMQETEADLVSGIYFRRVAPYSPVLFKTLKCDGFHTEWENYDDYPKDKPFEIDGCGFGCVLMKTDMLIDMAEKYGTWFSPIGLSGEDVAFCVRAKECGYKMVCDPNIQCGHVGHVIITEQFYKSLRGDGK